MLLKNVIEEYLSELKNIKRYSYHTNKSYAADLKHFYKFCQQNSKTGIQSLSEKFIKLYLMSLNESGLEVRSIARKLSSIKGLFNYAHRQNYIAINPAKIISNPKGKRQLPEVISTQKILEACRHAEETDQLPELVAAIFELLYGCALRVSELCALNLRSVDFNSATVKVTGKGSKDRIVPLGNKSAEILRKYLSVRKEAKDNKSLLVTGTGKRIYPRYVYRIVTKYLSKVTDIKKKSPHSLRHSAATHMLDSGANLNAVKEILGHESLSTTQIYTHVSIERLKSTYKKSHPKS